MKGKGHTALTNQQNTAVFRHWRSPWFEDGPGSPPGRQSETRCRAQIHFRGMTITPYPSTDLPANYQPEISPQGCPHVHEEGTGRLLCGSNLNGFSKFSLGILETYLFQLIQAPQMLHCVWP